MNNSRDSSPESVKREPILKDSPQSGSTPNSSTNSSGVSTNCMKRQTDTPPVSPQPNPNNYYSNVLANNPAASSIWSPVMSSNLGVGLITPSSSTSPPLVTCPATAAASQYSYQTQQQQMQSTYDYYNSNYLYQNGYYMTNPSGVGTPTDAYTSLAQRTAADSMWPHKFHGF